MITANIILQHIAFGVAEQSNGKVLVIKDLDSRLQIQIPFSFEEFDNFTTNLKTDRIVQATVIPNEAVKTLEKIREG